MTAHFRSMWALFFPRLLLVALAFAGTARATDYSDVASWPDEALKKLKLVPRYLRPLAPAYAEPSGFRVGGENATETLRDLKEIHGISIRELENAMRPGGLSGVGFLGPDEDLLEVLAKDNDTVLGRKLSHRAIGFHLRILGELGIVPDKKDFTYRGERFSVARYDTHGLQESPFADGTDDGRNAVLTNLRTGQSVRYAFLVAKMIERYGFYEGTGTPYRVDPTVAIAVLGEALAHDATP